MRVRVTTPGGSAAELRVDRRGVVVARASEDVQRARPGLACRIGFAHRHPGVTDAVQGRGFVAAAAELGAQCQGLLVTVKRLPVVAERWWT